MEHDKQGQTVFSELLPIFTDEPVRTTRLLLRPFRSSDLPDLYEYLSQKEQQRLAGNPPVDSLDDAREALEWFLAPAVPQIYLAIVLTEENKVIGNLTLGRYPFLDSDPVLRALRGVSLSYVLNENYWRRGLMTELLRAVYPLLFGKGGLDYIQSGYFPFNTASAALQRKLGMRLWTNGSFEQNGQRIETREMILFREEFLRSAEAVKE